MSDLTIYARLVDGKVVEYPVYELHIVNRAQPFDWYTKVQFAPQPEVPEFYTLEEIITVTKDLAGVDAVNVTYNVKPLSLAHILNTLRKPSEDGGLLGMPSNEPLAIADVPPATIKRVADLAAELSVSRLNAFVQTRSYDDVKSAVGYVGSAIPNFAAEGKRAFDLRDQSWQALLAYMDKVTTGVLPVPITVEEIEAVLPALTW